MSRLILPVVFTALAALSGCGPSHASIDPKEVVNVNVRPASGQLLYCPGDAFQIEVVAKLKDGTSCSNVDGNRGCLGKSNMVISPDLVRVSASSGKRVGDPEKFIWAPDKDLFATADTGIRLRAWLENATGSKSEPGEATLKPVYECNKELTIRGSDARNPGETGGKGPEVKIAITTLSTPFYPDAALVRLDWGAERAYMISQSADKPIKIVVRGGEGAKGPEGTKGTDGKTGADAKDECGKGEDGGNGTDGGPGGKGGDGGQGGVIKVTLDEANADKLKGRLLLAAPGGSAGPAGAGGAGGKAGVGGAQGKLKQGDANCKPAAGKLGQPGKVGASGQEGARGPDGPPPAFEMGKRATMFANELGMIQKIEGGKAQK
jgi:hypothetical protein